MIIEGLWLVKMVLAHLLTDFILQPYSWIEDRREKKFASPKLYLHGLVTGFVAWLIVGWQYWLVALIILVTHTLIDGWKSYQKETTKYFVIDQLLHLVVIALCWYVSFIHWTDIKTTWHVLANDLSLWKFITGFVFVTFPAGIMIGQITKQWSDKIKSQENEQAAGSLANAGKWIGIAERVIVLLLVLHSEYSAIGLLVAAKGIIRFSERDRQEAKTEYLVIGTLLSISIAVITGLLVI